jgi:hypothetical protein
MGYAIYYSVTSATFLADKLLTFQLNLLLTDGASQYFEQLSADFLSSQSRTSSTFING